MVDRCMRADSSLCDPSRITLDLWSWGDMAGSQFEESFLTHLSTIWFSLKIDSQKLEESHYKLIAKSQTLTVSV